MLELFYAFSLKSTQIQQAIRRGDDKLVVELDRELEPLVTAILAFRAETSLEIYMQLQFMVTLVKHSAEDRSCVERSAAALSTLLDRYFHGANGAAADMLLTMARGADTPETPIFTLEGGLSDVILDSLPDRVAVVTRDYRYLYSNEANARYLHRKPLELVGRHIVEFIGTPRFDGRVRAKLDSCFSGKVVDYIYKQKTKTDRLKAKRCRMTPVRGSTGEIMGALVILQEATLHADVFAS